MDTVVITPTGLLEILAQIAELQDVEIGLSETLDGNLQLQVGESFYEIDTQEAEDVSVDEDVVDSIEDVDAVPYERLDSEFDTIQDTDEYVESGIIKELVKTLLVGGMARLTAKTLRE